ncbi:BnaA09g13120D [Brassica napus]|uniref:BnaA09g13120D protein n=1 Tax=Brassica napus TaxID=3708 RepID=A0A078IMW3_BRANA|nr:BnaA09g13120D [Brassica napus]
MTRRRFDKVEHFDKDSGSDSSCLSSDSDPEEVEESEEEVSEEGDESPGVACFHISLSDIDDDDEPPEEEDEHYILGPCEHMSHQR